MLSENKNSTFRALEIAIPIIITLGLVGTAAISLASSKYQMRDSIRKADLAQIGRVMVIKDCFVPKSGAGEYDILDIIGELKTKHPEYVKALPKVIGDPQLGEKNKSYYKYIVASDGSHCVLYTSLENKNDEVTLPNIQRPTMGGKTGVFKSVVNGPNGTRKYYQISK